MTLADENRWGLLGKASVLAVTSYPHPHLADDPRQVAAREHSRRAGAAAAARREHRRSRRGKTARPRRCARCWSSIARIRCARAVTRAWIRSVSASRTSTRSASGARRTASTPINASGVLLDGTKVDGPAALRRALVAQKEQFVQDGHRQAADLCARPRDRVLRRAGDPRDRARGRRRRLPLVVDDSGDREERAVSDEEVAVMIVTKKAISRRTVLRGMGATVALPLLDAMVPALTAAAEHAGESRSAAWASSTIRTASSTRTGCRRASAREFELSPTLAPLAPFRDQLIVVTGLSSRSGRGARRRRRRSLARLGVVPDRRAREEVGQRRRERHVDGPDCGEGASSARRSCRRCS